MSGVNFGTVAQSYARSRNDIPHQLFESLQIRNIHFQGKKVADIGCGTGALTRKIKIRNGDVIGVDPSLELLSQARALSEEEYRPVEYKIGSAEKSGLETGVYDKATVFRAWHWFDRNKAIEEVKRILKPKGKLIIMDSGFTSESLLVVQTFSVLGKYFPNGIKPAGSKAGSKQRINGFPVEWFEEWCLQGLDIRDFYKLDYHVTFTNLEWIDRLESLSFMTVLTEEERQIAKFELLDFLKLEYGDNAVHEVPHFLTTCILVKNS